MWIGFEKKKYKKQAACDKRQSAVSKQNMKLKEEKVEVAVVTTEEKENLLIVGNETIEIIDYKTTSCANGETEICVTIKGGNVFTELSANSKK